jgi:hypothetical protein
VRLASSLFPQARPSNTHCRSRIGQHYGPAPVLEARRASRPPTPACDQHRSKRPQLLRRCVGPGYSGRLPTLQSGFPTTRPPAGAFPLVRMSLSVSMADVHVAFAVFHATSCSPCDFRLIGRCTSSPRKLGSLGHLVAGSCLALFSSKAKLAWCSGVCLFISILHGIMQTRGTSCNCYGTRHTPLVPPKDTPTQGGYS